MEKLLSIGKILNFQGLNGEVRVGYSDDKQDLLYSLKSLFLEHGSKIIPVTIESLRFHKNQAIVKFKEFSSINDVAELKGALLKIPKSYIDNVLEEDEFFIDDLVGLDAYLTDGSHAGKIVSIVKTHHGQDLLEIEDDNKVKHLVPFVKEIVPEVDVKGRKVIINNIQGLLESKKG